MLGKASSCTNVGQKSHDGWVHREIFEQFGVEVPGEWFTRGRVTRKDAV